MAFCLGQQRIPRGDQLEKKMLSQDQVNELLEAAKPSIIESLKAELKQSVTYEMKQAAMLHIKAHTEAWIKENILPEITKALIEGKDGLVSIGVKLGPAIVEEVVTGMTKDIGERLGKSWERKKIFDALVG